MNKRRQLARERARKERDERVEFVLASKGGVCSACANKLPANPKSVFVAVGVEEIPLLTFCRKKPTDKSLADVALLCANCKGV